MLEELKAWREQTAYCNEDDFVFASVAKNGSQPLQPDMVLKRHIRPALARIGVSKTIGFHSFRHGLAVTLRQNGVDIKTAQELLRHANSRLTLEVYMQSVSEGKRAAQGIAVQSLLGSARLQHPRASSKTA